MMCDTSLELEREPPASAKGRSSLLASLGKCTWTTTSGQRLTHVVYSLIGCPPPETGLYMLVRRDGRRKPRILATGHTQSPHPTVNLARIRQSGAKLGANEVHLYPATSSRERIRLLADLAEGAVADQQNSPRR